MSPYVAEFAGHAHLLVANLPLLTLQKPSCRFVVLVAKMRSDSTQSIGAVLGLRIAGSSILRTKKCKRGSCSEARLRMH